MENSTASTVLDNYMINSYRIVVRTLTKDPVLKSTASNFGLDLIQLLDAYDKKRQAIEHNGMLSNEERILALRKLRDEYAASLSPFLVRAENLLTGFRNYFFTSIRKRFAYKGDPSPDVEAQRQSETRSMLKNLDGGEMIRRLLDASTSELVFYSILGAPVSMLPEDILENAAVEKVRRTDPGILSYRDGIVEVAANILSNLENAYAYLGMEVPRKITFALPGFASLLTPGSNGNKG